VTTARRCDISRTFSAQIVAVWETQTNDINIHRNRGFGSCDVATFLDLTSFRLLLFFFVQVLLQDTQRRGWVLGQKSCPVSISAMVET